MKKVLYVTVIYTTYQSSIVLQLMKTSSSSLNYMTQPPSLRESLVRQILLKDNFGNQVCTPHLKPPYLLLLVLYQNPPQHFNLLHQLPHHQQLTHTRQKDNKVTRKFTTLWTTDTRRFSQCYQHTISTYTTTVGYASTTCYTTIAQFR